MSPIAKIFSGATDGARPETWLWPAQDSAEACWRNWARALSDWLSVQGLSARDTLAILPVGAVLAQARAGWSAAVGGWMPRVDTIASVASGMAWSWAAPAHGVHEALPPLTLDPIVDRLQAARSLGKEAWGRQWAQRDRRGFEFALDQVVAAAHAWLRRMQAIEPAGRSAYADEARVHLAGSASTAAGPGGRERLLLAWALEWAVNAAERGLETDVLFELRPSAFVVTTAGAAISPGTEAALTLGVMRHLAAQGVAVRWVSAEPVSAGVDVSGKPDQTRDRPPVLCACADAEDEAQQAAAQVLEAVNEARACGEAQQPVALIALDRLLIRRVRAMLEGAGAQIVDETGWRLSTTRAAAVLSRLVQASHPKATTDDLLDWFKSGWLHWPAASPEGTGGATDRALANAAGHLEKWCRRHGMLGAWGLQVPSVDELGSMPLLHESQLPQLVPEGRQAMPASAARLWHWAREVLTPLQLLWHAKQVKQPRLQDWLLALRDALAVSGSLAALKHDAAGELALLALRFDQTTGSIDIEKAWQGLSSQTPMDGRAFMRWMSAVLEGTTFRPPAPGGQADVVITPMARAALRPFHAIVLPGADERQLGALAPQSGWLSTRLCEALDLATPQTLRAAQWDAFQLLMNRPGVICLHRQAQGSEPLEPSAWLEKWSNHAGIGIAAQPDARRHIGIVHAPLRAPLPTLQGHAWALPAKITATSYEALRQCPYRFFATTVLGLREQDELDEGLDRSDFGIWLHEVLRRFHLQRQDELALSTAEEDTAAWLETAQAVIREKGLDRDGQRPYFLPFQADLGRLAQGYVRWLREHEDAGWSVTHAEVTEERQLDIAPGLSVRLHGQLDRVDARHVDGQRERFVLDYKTGSLITLKTKVAFPLEDTQLAFYAALSGPRGSGATRAASHDTVSAAYLHLDARGVTQVDHEQVEDSAQALLQGLSQDWTRLHVGAAMPAMGEGAACAFCQARGLCRKDHWTLAEPVTEEPTP
jgi:ATP-dependent helicase/nuclease subunit B